jgi:hypothetical protein
VLPPRNRLLVPAFLALAGCLAVAGAIGAPSEDEPTSLTARHVDGDGRFFVPWSDDPKSFWNIVKWQLFTPNPYDKSRPPEVPVVANDGAYLAGVEHSATVTWVGHATFAVHDSADVFLTDPHFGKRALIPARQVPPGVPVESVPPDAFAVISHNHYDHLDAWTVETLPASVGWYVPLGLAEWFRERGREDVTELDWWQSATRGRFTITCLPSQHWSRRIEQASTRRSGARGSSTPATIATTSRATPATSTASPSLRAASRRSTWRCCRSAPTSRAGS